MQLDAKARGKLSIHRHTHTLLFEADTAAEAATLARLFRFLSRGIGESADFQRDLTAMLDAVGARK